MELIYLFFDNFLILLNAMSLYILVGLFIAGVLKQIIPDDFIIRHLGKGSISSVVKSTIFGIPLPVCSCSVIPLAQSLRKEGASKGAVQSFLIATPITGVDSILATYSFFGIFFTIYRVISSIIIAILVGILQNIFSPDVQKNNKDEKELNSCSCNSSCNSSSKEIKKFSFKSALSYAYGTLFEDMAKALFLGLCLGAIFTSFAPQEYTSLLFDNKFLTYIVILLFSTPLYVCATASLPIAAALMVQGMSAGAAFIFLTAGPATSFITMSVVYKTLGKKSLFIYLFSICILSLIFGISLDIFGQNFDILNIVKNSENISIISQMASIILLSLMIFYFFKPIFKKKKKSCCSSDTCCDKENKTKAKFSIVDNSDLKINLKGKQ